VTAAPNTSRTLPVGLDANNMTTPKILVPLLAIVLLAGCAMPSADGTSAQGTPVPVGAARAASPTATVRTGLGESRGWVLQSWRAKAEGGILSATGRLHNVDGSPIAVFQVTYLGQGDTVRATFLGSVDGVSRGKTSTVQFFSTDTAARLPKGRIEFEVTAG
jgi:hypothetical protein